MCDYSLHAVASRPAKVGETLVTTSFYGTTTRGFAAKEEPRVALCLLPGTELAFEQDVRYNRFRLSTKNAGFRVARFCTIQPRAPHQCRESFDASDRSSFDGLSHLSTSPRDVPGLGERQRGRTAWQYSVNISRKSATFFQALWGVKNA